MNKFVRVGIKKELRSLGLFQQKFWPEIWHFKRVCDIQYNNSVSTTVSTTNNISKFENICEMLNFCQNSPSDRNS